MYPRNSEITTNGYYTRLISQLVTFIYNLSSSVEELVSKTTKNQLCSAKRKTFCGMEEVKSENMTKM